jgi:hypothetical protein
LPLYDKKGRLDRLALQAILKVQQIADTRVKGAVTQKLQIQQHVLNQTLSPEDQYYEKLSIKELDALQKQIDENREAKKSLVIEGDVVESE